MFGSTSGPLFIAKPNAVVDFPCTARVHRSSGFSPHDEAGEEASEGDEEGTNKQVVVVVVVAAGQVLQLSGSVCLSVQHVPLHQSPGLLG